MFNKRQLARYNRIRRFMHAKWPVAFTDVDSGLPKMALRTGVKEAILAEHPNYTADDQVMPELVRRGIIFREYVVPERGVTEWRMRHGWNASYTFAEDLQFFLRIYCTGLRYWYACSRAGSVRISHTGLISQAVTADQINYATEKLNQALAKGINRERYLKIIRQGQ